MFEPRILEPMDTKKNTGVPFSLRPFLNNEQCRTRMGYKALNGLFFCNRRMEASKNFASILCGFGGPITGDSQPGGAVEVRQASNPNAKSKPAVSKIMKSAGVECCFKTLLDPG